MTPHNKAALIPDPPKRRITRSATFKLGLDGFSSIGFFSSHGTTCDPSQCAELSEELYRDAYDDVERAVREYKEKMEDMAQQVLHPDRAPKPPEENPFKVSELRPAAREEAKQEVVQAQTGHGAETGRTNATSSTVDELKTKEVPADTENKRGRGRPPKTQPVTKPEDIPLALEHAAPTDPAQFKADDADLPKELGGTSEVPPATDRTASTTAAAQAGIAAQTKSTGPQLVPPAKPVPSQEERIAAVQAALVAQKKRTPENVQEGIKEFFRGALNKDKLVRPPAPEYDPFVPLLESICKRSPESILADPRKTGLEAGVGWRKFSEHTAKWSDRLKGVATETAILRYPDNCMDLLDFLHGAAKLNKLDAELGTFLIVFRNVNAAAAMALRAASTEQNKPMAEMVQGLDLENITEGQVLSLVNGAPVQSGQPAQTESLWP